MDVELTIENKQENKIYQPIVEEGITWTTDREGAPGQLQFKVVKDTIINFQEGNCVKLRIDGTPVFWGYVFKKSRSNDGLISVTAYDQLRYFKNKDTCNYPNITASQLLKRIAGEFNLKTGNIDDTKSVIENFVKDNSTIFDMMKDALDETLKKTVEMYVLYDDFGKISLKNLGNMKVPYKIDENTAQDFDYETSIDGDTYNRIQLVYQGSSDKDPQVFVKDSKYTTDKWGILQYCEKVNNKEDIEFISDALLKIYDNKSRSISVKGIFGDLRVRAGSQVPVFLTLGDIVTNNYFIVEKCTHNFKQSEHTMDLELLGGEYLAQQH